MVERFEEKVERALRDVMLHAVRGDERELQHTYCTDPEHARHILSHHKVKPVNEYVAEKLLEGK